MRRIALAAAALGALLALSPASADPSVKITTSHSMFGGAFNPDNSGFTLMVNTYEEQTVGGATTGFVNVFVSVSNGQPNGWANANGALAVDFDPLLQQGKIFGIVTGGQGPIAVNVTFLATSISTNPPYGSIEVVPTPPQEANAALALSRQGRISGTVSSTPSGQITGTNGYASAGSYTTVRAAA